MSFTSNISGKVPMINFILQQKIPKTCVTKDHIELPEFLYPFFKNSHAFLCIDYQILKLWNYQFHDSMQIDSLISWKLFE